MNTDIEQTVNQCATGLEYKHVEPQKKAPHYEMPYRPWEIVHADIFIVNNKILPCTANYYSKFSCEEGRQSLSR